MLICVGSGKDVLIAELLSYDLKTDGKSRRRKPGRNGTSGITRIVLEESLAESDERLTLNALNFSRSLCIKIIGIEYRRTDRNGRQDIVELLEYVLLRIKDLGPHLVKEPVIHDRRIARYIIPFDELLRKLIRVITNKVKAVTFPKFDIDRCIYADALKPHLRIFVSRMPELKVNGHDLRTCLLESIRRASYDLLHFPVDLEQVEVGSISDPAALQDRGSGSRGPSDRT